MGLLSKQNKYKTAEQRKNESIQKLKELNVAYSDSLPVIEDSKQVILKDVNVVSKKAISTLLVIQVAFDAMNNDLDNSKKMFEKFSKDFGVENCLNSKEEDVLNGKFTKQDLINLTWEYEIYWVLVWALGIINDIEVPDKPLDYKKAISIVSECDNYDDFMKKVKMRDIEEVLDMLDLYYRYNWATDEHRLNSKTSIGKINHEVVVERRKGLEWLVSDIEDWNEISLDT